MSRSLLQLVLRTTADADGSDPDLLRRFVASRDEGAFAALVRRHGPLVWAVCRHLIPNRADAEDAFQATFLALAKSAKSVRKPEQLAGWLHGAAVRIAGKAKRGFARRTIHERKTARPEADTPVAAGSWNEMLAAVHDEVAKLPRSLRAAFVLCDLEGVDAAEAANRLGLKASSLYGQLARARQRLLDALTKRGIGAGVATIGTVVAVPQALADQAAGVIGGTPSAAVVELASEVVAMKVSQLKLLAAGFVVACGLSLTGLGLLPKADGQPPAGVPVGPGVGAPRLGGPPGGLPGEGGPGLPPPKALPAPGTGSANGGGEGGMAGMMGGMGGAPKPSAAFEYLFVAKPGIVSEVMELFRSKATQNWEYTGPLDVDPNDAMATAGIEGATKTTRVVLVFKRAAKPAPPGMGGMGGGGMMPGGMGMGGMSGPGGLGAGGGGMTPGVAGMGAPGGMAPGMGGPGGGGGSKPDTGLAKLLDPLFQRLDKNGDGKLTGDEMPKGLKDTYRLYDKNTDDAVSRTEFAEYLVKVLGADPASVPGMAGAVGGEGSGGVTAVNNASGQVTVVYKLRHVNATAELVGKIRTHYADARGQKTSAGLAISADARINALVVSGSQGTVDLVRGIIDTLDVKPAEKEKPKVYSAMFKVTEVAPSEAAVALNAFFRMQDGVNSVGADPFTTLIINASTASVLDDVRRWVKEKYPKAEEVKAGAGGR